jgi:lysophospholipase L1-like esterase
VKLFCLSLLAAACLAGQSDWAGLNVYGSDDAEVRPPGPDEQRAVFIGDDIVANWGKNGGSFFPGHAFFNRGIPGQTTPQMLVRFRQDVVALRPKVVVIEGGLNDIGGVMGPGTEGTISENLASMIDIARAHRIRIVIASLSPVCDCVINETGRRSPGRIAAINGTLREMAQQTGSIYLNYYSVLVEPRTRQMKRELTDDGFLPNAAGYALMTPLAEKAVSDALLTR